MEKNKIILFAFIIFACLLLTKNCQADKLSAKPKKFYSKSITNDTWKLNPAEIKELDDFIRELKENEVVSEWHTNVFQYKISGKINQAVNRIGMIKIKFGKDKELENLLEKSGLDQNDFKFKNLFVKYILGIKRYTTFRDIFIKKLSSDLTSQQEQSARFLTQALFDYTAIDEMEFPQFSGQYLPNRLK